MIFKALNEKFLTPQNFKVLAWVLVMGIFLMSVESAWASNVLQEGVKNAKGFLFSTLIPLGLGSGGIVGAFGAMKAGNVWGALAIVVVALILAFVFSFLGSDNFTTEGASFFKGIDTVPSTTTTTVKSS